jgi:aspartate racemase
VLNKSFAGIARPVIKAGNLTGFEGGTMRTIGILGGMGPEATRALMERIAKAVNAKTDRDHVPLLVDMNPQVPCRSAAISRAGAEDPAPVLMDMAKRLETAGAKALAMPCNTAHHYCGAIAGAVDIPFIDMVEVAAKAAFDVMGKGGKVGVLGSTTLQEMALFDRPLEALGCEVVYPKDQKVLLDTIQTIKARGVTRAARSILQRASHDLLWQGASVQIMACTEFSMVKNGLDVGVVGVDPMDELVREIIRFAKGDGDE